MITTREPATKCVWRVGWTVCVCVCTVLYVCNCQQHQLLWKHTERDKAGSLNVSQTVNGGQMTASIITGIHLKQNKCCVCLFVLSVCLSCECVLCVFVCACVCMCDLYHRFDTQRVAIHSNFSFSIHLVHSQFYLCGVFVCLCVCFFMCVCVSKHMSVLPLLMHRLVLPCEPHNVFFCCHVKVM